MDNKEVRKHKELSILREGVHSNWREELQEEHPYVDVMPSTNQQAKDVEKKVKDKKKVEKEMKESTSPPKIRSLPTNVLKQTTKATKSAEKEDKFSKSLPMRDTQRDINKLLLKQATGKPLKPTEKARLNLYKHKLDKKNKK